MLQQRLYTLLKWVLSLSFADVMCFFISVYLLIRVSEKCQNILFLLLERRKILDFHRCGIPSYFSFRKQSFIAPPILSFHKSASITESSFFFFGCHSGCHPMLLKVISTFLCVIFHFRSIISTLLRKNSLVNAKKCFTNNVLCKILITFA